MNRKIFVGIAAVTLAVTLTGCSQVHFGKDAVTIGEVKQNKKTVNVKKLNLPRYNLQVPRRLSLKKTRKRKSKRIRKIRLKSRLL